MYLLITEKTSNKACEHLKLQSKEEKNVKRKINLCFALIVKIIIFSICLCRKGCIKKVHDCDYIQGNLPLELNGGNIEANGL